MNHRIFYLFIGIYFSCVKSLAQEKLYFNQTEVGFLYGRGMENWEGKHEERIDFSFNTFHGAMITPKQVIGFSVGLDQYQDISILPIAMGYRGFIGKEGKPQFFGGLDLGTGSTLLEKTQEDQWFKRWYEGGILFSPMAGFKFPSKEGNTSLSMTIAYKRQEYFFFEGFKDLGGTQPFPSSALPPGYNSVNETAYLLNSFVFRMGLMF
jgi:hypothetical protein